MGAPRISPLRDEDLGLKDGPATGAGLRDVFRRLFSQVNPFFDALNKLGNKGITLTDNLRCDLVTAKLTHGVAATIALSNLSAANSALALGSDTGILSRHVPVQMTGKKQCQVTAWFDNPNTVDATVVLLLLEEGRQAASSPVLGAVYHPQRTAIADAAYTALATDHRICFTSISAARVVTVPAAASSNKGQEYFIKDESGSASGANTIAVAPASGTIDGVASKVVVNAAYGFTRVYSNGTAWFTG